MSLPDDPLQLFGAEACADLRALKRAYARLIKQHGPETDPEGFRHVQERYERARRRLEAAASPEGAAAAPEATPARPPEEWARWLQAGAEPPTVEALRAELAAAQPHDVAAPVLAFGLDAGLDVSCTRARLMELLARPDLVPQSFGLCRMAFALDPRLLDEDWHRLGAEVRRLAPGPPFDVARIDALLANGRVAEAWREWGEVGPGLLAELPEVASGRLYELFKRAAWVVSEEELERARQSFQEVGLPLADSLREGLDQFAVTVAAARRAEADPKVPRPIVATVRRILGADGSVTDPGVLMLVRDLLHARPALPEELARIDPHHPVLSTTILRQVGRISGRYRAVDQATSPTPDSPAVRAALRTLEWSPEAFVAAPPPAGFGRMLLLSDRRLALVLLCLGPGALAGLLPLPPGLAWLLGMVVIGLWILLSRSTLGLASPTAAPKPAATRPAEARIRALAREQGLWMHELVAIARRAGLEATAEACEQAGRDDWADARLLGPEHLRRASFPLPEAS